MTSTAKKVPIRIRSIAQFGVAAVFALGLAAGCSSGGDSGSPGKGGSAGSAGVTASGGKSGAAGTTSSAGGANGGSSEGGMTNGEAGSSEAGAAGMSSGRCGDGHVDPGEECDDGNTVDGDGCSSICTNKCELCEKAANCGTKYDLSQPCKTPAECQNRENEAVSFELCYGTTGEGQKPAASGPAAGTLKSKLCQAVIACVRRTNCITDPSDTSPTACYCGAGNDMVSCETHPLGPCATEIADAAEARSYSAVQQVWSNPDPTVSGSAMGAAANILFNCDASACASECFQDKAPTKCSQCALGSNAHDQHLLCPDYNACYFQAQAFPYDTAPAPLPLAKLCTSAMDCALRTGCGATGAESCYGNGTGPCATEFAAAADSTDVATILSRIQTIGSTYPVNVAQSLLECEAAHCAADCFPAAAGGSGGAGGTSAGTGGGGGSNAGTGGANAGTGGT